jgi:hypothetical protein
VYVISRTQLRQVVWKKNQWTCVKIINIFDKDLRLFWIKSLFPKHVSVASILDIQVPILSFDFSWSRRTNIRPTSPALDDEWVNSTLDRPKTEAAGDSRCEYSGIACGTHHVRVRWRNFCVYKEVTSPQWRRWSTRTIETFATVSTTWKNS